MSETKPHTVVSMTAPQTIDLGVRGALHLQIVVTETGSGVCEITCESPAFRFDNGSYVLGFQRNVHSAITIPAEYRQAIAAAILGAPASPEDEP